MTEKLVQNQKAILEALLFVSPDPLSLKQIRQVIDGITDGQVNELISELSVEYEQRESGLQIVTVAEGFQMLTRLECSPWLRKLESTKVSNKLSQPALETLAIIAYKQPVIKAEVDAVRGVSSDGTIKTLLDRKLVKILGRKEMPGRPLLYGTTSEFLRYFGLNAISELPTLRDIEEMDGEEPGHLSLDEIREMDTGTAPIGSADVPDQDGMMKPEDFSNEAAGTETPFEETAAIPVPESAEERPYSASDGSEMGKDDPDEGLSEN